MKLSIRQFYRKHQFSLVSGLAIVGGVLLLRLIGLLQPYELKMFDWMLRLRPPEPLDERIIIIGIDEADFQELNNAVISDQVIADLIRKVNAQKPRLIGLDLYRNLPIEPGQQELVQVLKTTPNLIGITKVIETTQLSGIPGHPVLVQSKQLGASDVITDPDGRVRRALLYPDANSDIPGLGLKLALDYLARENITPADNPILTISGISIPPFSSNDGGYAHADDGGYQILLNLRGPSGHFRRISLSEVRAGKIPPDLLKDRIVLIGNTNVIDRDLFLTSYTGALNSADTKPIYGVELHANITSQLISTILDGRPLIQVLPHWVELALLIFCVALGMSLQNKQRHYFQNGVLTLLASGCLLGGSYFLLIQGWWLPVVPAGISLILASIVMGSFHAQHLKMLATQDELTQVANRRTFNEALAIEWYRALRSHKPISLILCDVDHFKLYNDTYGHPQGDECLRQVARAIQSAAKRTSDLTARYGGEEFVVLLPGADAKGALQVAENIRKQVIALNLEHQSSKTANMVTLSLGVASLTPALELPPSSLLDSADASLYQAKQEGRNRAILIGPP